MNQEERRKKRQKETRNAAIILILFFLLIVIAAVGAVFGIRHFLPEKEQNASEQIDTESTETLQESETEQATESTETVQEPVIDPLTQQAIDMVAEMTLEDKVAQMFVITPEALTGYNTVTAAGEATKASYDEYPVGGLIYMANNLVDPAQTQKMLTNMQAYSSERTGLPIFLSVDEEGGSVARIASNSAFGVTDVGNMSAVGATGDAQNAYNAGTVIGTYLAELGFNVDYAPVADVLTDSDNTVIGDRAFGSDSQLVSEMVTAELQGLLNTGVYGVVKHFPGHGGVTGDSHDGLVTTEKTLEELTAEELVPFQSAVDAGVSFVMVGHIAAPNVTGDNTPASLSGVMITDVLRGQMGYDGIVITDAMNMGAITESYTSDEAAILAINAGADMILMPQDFKTAYTGVLEAVNNGTISQTRINEAVVRIIRTKLSMGQLQ